MASVMVMSIASYCCWLDADQDAGGILASSSTLLGMLWYARLSESLAAYFSTKRGSLRRRLRVDGGAML